MRYRNGEGVAQDHVEATKWYHCAAEQGHIEAQFKLAVMYRNGEGIPQDSAEAAKWYSRAEERIKAQSAWKMIQMREQF